MSLFDPKKVLVATDLSPASEAAVAFAAQLGHKLGSEIILLTAISPIVLVDYGVFDDDSMRQATDEQRRVAEARLAEIASEHFPQHVEVITRAVNGYPISSIVETADEEDVDLIIMGTHGRNALMSFLVGSVVQGVQFATSRPLITVPQKKEVLKLSATMTILCPVNFSDISLNALTTAAELGARLGADVIALHMVEAGELSDGRDEIDRLDQWIPGELKSICQIRVLVRRGNAAEEVVRYADQHDVDLIVVGARHKRFADTTVLGITTERITRHAKCAVMTIMEPREASNKDEQAKSSGR